MVSIKNTLIVIFLVILPVSTAAEPEEHSTNSTKPPLVFAQDTEKKEEAPEKKENGADVTPLPPAKFSITTEKPVRGIPGEIKPEKKEEVSESPALDGAESAAKESDQPQVTQTAETTPSTGVPVVASPAAAVPAGIPSAAGTDSTAVSPVKEDKAGIPPDISQHIEKKEEISTKFMEELSIVNVSTGNLRTMKYVVDDLYRLRGMVYGEEQGYIRILEADDDGNFKEVWKSPPCNSPIRGLFVQDLDGDGETEVVAYTADGNFYIYSYTSHDLIYKSPEGTYQNINCMVVANMDNDPQMELFFIGVKPGTIGADSGNPAGYFIQFDTKTLFEEWTSSEMYTATDMLIGNVDTDPEDEIILNTGEILSLQFKNVKWKSTVEFGSRLYLIDLDSDGILELVTEYGESYVKIIDVDQRREKW